MSHEERNYVDQIAVIITLKIWICNGYVYGMWNGAMLFITGVNNVDGSIGKHHEIDHYEIAIGTDRRYPSTRTNVWPFTNVGLNVTWTISDLKLIPRKAVYYVTVRAYSVSSAMVDVTSNGIRVGYGSHVISTGTIELAKYVVTGKNIAIML